jgi:hypothetical protein
VLGVDLLLGEAEHELGRQIYAFNLGVLKNLLVGPLRRLLANNAPFASETDSSAAQPHITLATELADSNQDVNELVDCFGLGVLEQCELGDDEQVGRGEIVKARRRGGLLVCASPSRKSIPLYRTKCTGPYTPQSE